MIPALSVTRPWPTLILYEGKTAENRTWPTRYRGPLLLHAARSWDDEALPFARHVAAGRGEDLDMPERPVDYTLGLVGLVDLVDVCSETVRRPEMWCACGPWAAAGQYHWRLANPRPFPVPIPCRGRLGLWTPPAELAAEIERQLAIQARYATEAAQVCELCHDKPAVRTRKGRRVCAGCADAGDYYDSLTPAELWAEEESMARYVTETATWGEG